MNNEKIKNLTCTEFEDNLIDYLDRSLNAPINLAVAEHAMQCPLCHSLLNDVKGSLAVCHQMAAPTQSMTKLEARILSMTMPETAMNCEEFEGYLTDYLDGFLPAAVFHRWERHAVLCDGCTDLPGQVVRSIAACYTYKTEELSVPEGLHKKILQSTIGTVAAAELKPSAVSQIAEWIRGLGNIIPLPQFAPVALLLVIAFITFSQAVSSDGSFKDIYSKSFALAEQTYLEGANAFGRNQ